MSFFHKLKNIFIFITLFIILKLIICTNVSYATSNDEENQFIYLSDISWMSGSSAGWGNITKDKTTEGKTLSQKVNGATVVFDKGIFAHAKSTIIYDLTNYDYDYFTTYYGVSAHQGSGGSVKFYIYTSDNGSKWNLQTSSNPTVMNGSTNAEFVKISIKGKKYLKLYADPNGSNGNDHAQYLNSKLIKEGYSDNVEISVEELDELIKTKYSNGENDEQLEKYILQRELINNIGQYQLSKFYQGTEGEKHKETFHWIFNDLDRLRLFVTGGEPNGTWLRTLQVLNDLYQTYKSDLEDTGTTPNGVPLKDIYLKMMLTISLTHSKDITFWIASSGSLSPNPNASNALVRYSIYKDMLVRGRLKTEVFEQLEIEEMRYIMQSFIGDDEIEWMRDYTTASGKNWYNASNFIQYKGVSIAEYRNDKYYGTNRKNYENKYKLTNYSVKNNKYYPKNWIIMEAGGVCWQISNLGVNIVVSHGVPAMSLGQYPSAGAHECYVVYTLNGYKDGCWTIYNSAAGWDETNSSAYAANTRI